MGHNGQQVFFDGVSISNSFVQENTAYQLNGIIHISSNWTSFNINDFAHEYGHYLQQQKMGGFDFMSSVAIPSATNLITNPETHNNQWYEIEATRLGEEFLRRNGF